MISDLFYKYKCDCGNENPMKFKRIRKIKIKEGIDWKCQCQLCGRKFIIQWEREGSINAKSRM